MNDDLDGRLRAAAFAYLDALTQASGGLVTRAALEAFEFEGQRIPLIERQRGIRKFRDLPAALSILTTYAPSPEQRPYDDGVGIDNYPRYKWQGSDPEAFDNRALRFAMASRVPLIWFIGVGPGLFEPHFPVWIVGEEPAQTQFVVALELELVDAWSPNLALEPHAPARLYARRIVKARLHQPVFRSRVLLAYERQCALCRLRHPELLEAAHIRRDSAGGEPIVPNGIAMCAIHHRAFDANILGIEPSHRVEIRRDVLEELDGPTLQHALQGLHGGVLILPSRPAEHPRKDLLEERYEEFLAAG